MTRRRTCLLIAAVTATSAVALTLPASASGNGPDKTNAGATAPGQQYSQLIVHFADGAAASTSDAAAASEVAAVGRQSGQELQVVRRLSTKGALVQVRAPLDKAGADRLIARFTDRASVAYAEVDAVMTATLTPSDALYPKQWDLFEPVGGMNVPTAWDSVTGAGVVVAVLDTGITAHPDLDANVIAGYDFVSSATAARDGNGRDANPADQGDWYARNECGKGIPASNSSWHGTHVAGTIAAVSNTVGITGVAYGAKVQPVRVLAKCGGTLADIADAITWASGGQVGSIPVNPTPAKVINMSLGGSGVCGSTYQTAINAAVSRGTTVIVAAGNSGANAANYQPASCANVVVVAASNRQGAKASYSNYGAKVDVTAPGGQTSTGSADGILSTLNGGTTTPTTANYVYYQGTSMATPHVAGLAALALSKQPSYTPADLESLLKAGTRTLPGACTGGCGAGLVDAVKTLSLVP